MANAAGRRVKDYLGLTPRDGVPFTWPFAFRFGLGYGIVVGAVMGFTTPGRGFSWEAFFSAIAFGVVLYAPLIRWISHRNSKL